MRRISLLVLALVLLARPASAAQTCVAYGGATCSGGTAGTISGTGSDNQVARWDGTTDLQGSGCTLDDNGVVSCTNQNSLGTPAPNLTAIYDNCGVAASCTDCPNGTFCLIDVNSGCGVYDVRVCFGSTGLSGGVMPDSGNTTVAQSRIFRGNANTSGQWLVDHYDVRDFGALGDGSTDDTTAIRNAIWAACTATGPATVYFPGTSAYYKITERLPVYSESTAHIPNPTGGTSTSTIISGCKAAGDPLPCCAARNVGYCGVEPYRCDGITFLGDGPKKSRIVQTFVETTSGDLDTRPVFDVRAADWITFRGLSLENGTTKATYGSGSSKDALAQTVLAREYRAGVFAVDGTDHMVLEDVHFAGQVCTVRQRGHSDNVTPTYDFRAINTTATGTNYGYQGFDNTDGVLIENYQVSLDTAETNAPHGLYISPDFGRAYNVRIAHVLCGNWDGVAECDVPAAYGADCMRTANITGLQIDDVTVDNCGGGGGGGEVKNATISNINIINSGGWSFIGDSSDVEFGPMTATHPPQIAASNCIGAGDPVACCTGAGTGTNCPNSALIGLGDTCHNFHIHDITASGARYSTTWGVIHFNSGGGYMDNNVVENVTYTNTKTGSDTTIPALWFQGRGIQNVARHIRYYPKSTSNIPIRIPTGSADVFIFSPDTPGFDDSNLPDVKTVMKGSQVRCHNCAETVTTGVCATGWTNSNLLATFDGQNWICGDGVLPATPTPTATATPTATPTVTATAATPTPTATVTPTLSTPLPTP